MNHSKEVLLSTGSHGPCFCSDVFAIHFFLLHPCISLELFFKYEVLNNILIGQVNSKLNFNLYSRKKLIVSLISNSLAWQATQHWDLSLSALS